MDAHYEDFLVKLADEAHRYMCEQYSKNGDTSFYIDNALSDVLLKYYGSHYRIIPNSDIGLLKECDFDNLYSHVL